MSYCTEANLKARFGDNEINDLIDRDNNDSPDTDALASAIGDADALIDGYVGGKYSTPLDPVPALINTIACNITRYVLWGNKAPDEIRKRYDDSIAQLKDISKGAIALPSDLAPTTNSTAGISYASSERVFTMDSLQDF